MGKWTDNFVTGSENKIKEFKLLYESAEGKYKTMKQLAKMLDDTCDTITEIQAEAHKKNPLLDDAALEVLPEVKAGIKQLQAVSAKRSQARSEYDETVKKFKKTYEEIEKAYDVFKKHIDSKSKKSGWYNKSHKKASDALEKTKKFLDLYKKQI